MRAEMKNENRAMLLAIHATTASGQDTGKQQKEDMANTLSEMVQMATSRTKTRRYFQGGE